MIYDCEELFLILNLDLYRTFLLVIFHFSPKKQTPQPPPQLLSMAAVSSFPSPQTQLHPARLCPGPRGHGKAPWVLGFTAGACALSHRSMVLTARARKKHRQKRHPVDPVDPVAKAQEVMEALETQKEKAGMMMFQQVSTCFHPVHHLMCFDDW